MLGTIFNCWKEQLGNVKVKVKCTLVQALSLCSGRTAHRGSRGITLLFLDHGTRKGWGVGVVRSRRHAPAALYPRERSGTHCTGGWMGPGPVWTGAENLAPTGIWPPDHPACSQSLYRLSYPANSARKCKMWKISRRANATEYSRRNRGVETVLKANLQ